MNDLIVGKIEFTHPDKCTSYLVDKMPNNWEEEFGDNIDESWFRDILIRQMFKQYNLFDSKVKIKCKKGAILIEKN